MKYLAIVFISLISLTGCVGIMYTQGSSSQIEKLNKYSECDDKPLTQMTRTDIVKIKGEPTEIVGNKWIYRRDDKRLFGIAPAFILPIPLIVPYDDAKVEIEFKGSYVLKATEYDSKMYGGYCGIVLHGHFVPKIGCIGAWGE